MEQKERKFHFNCVMVVDDTYADRYIAERTLRKNAFSEKVILKESAMAALEYLQWAINTPQEFPQLIFLDINMPEMNGFEFIEVYRTLSDDIRKKCIILMLTTSLNPGDSERAKDNPYISSFLNKPLNKEKITQLLSSNLEDGLVKVAI